MKQVSTIGTYIFVKIFLLHLLSDVLLKQGHLLFLGFSDEGDVDKMSEF